VTDALAAEGGPGLPLPCDLADAKSIAQAAPTRRGQ
jgi:hypothetical protein